MLHLADIIAYTHEPKFGLNYVNDNMYANWLNIWQKVGSSSVLRHHFHKGGTTVRHRSVNKLLSIIEIRHILAKWPTGFHPDEK